MVGEVNMNEKIFVGIDPGASGAVAVVTAHGIVDKEPFETETDARDFLESWCGSGNQLFAVLEKVHAMPKQGVTSTFKFGMNYGVWRGLLCCLRIPFDEVTPQRWQKALGCLTHGDKNISKARAQALFPRVEKITHRIADALLIAEYCRRTRGQP